MTLALTALNAAAFTETESGQLKGPVWRSLARLTVSRAARA